MVVILFFFVGLFLFVIGLQQALPGKKIAEYIENQIVAQTGISTRISPIELEDVRNIKIDQLSILAPPTLPVNNLFVIQNIKLALLPDLLKQSLMIQGKAYEGDIRVYLDYVKQDQIYILAKNITLDQIPALNLFSYAQIKGVLSLEGSIVNLQDLKNRKTQIPKGKLTVQFNQIQIKPKNLKELIPWDVMIPDIEFSDITLNLNYDNLLKIEKIKMRGAINGTVEGQIQLNQRNLMASKVQLHMKFELSNKLKQALGPLGFIIKNFQCGNVIDFDISGTLRRLRNPVKRACS